MASVGSFWSFWFKAPPLTQPRIALAMAVALIADAMQLLLGPLGWTFADEFIDLAAMAAISFLIGFHPLLLPTFLIEVLPIVDMLPTWTACTATLLVLRRRSEVHAPPNSGPTIDAEVIVDPPPVPPSQNAREKAGKADHTP